MKQFAYIYKKDYSSLIGSDQLIKLDGRYTIQRCIQEAIEIAKKRSKDNPEAYYIRVFKNYETSNRDATPVSVFCKIFPTKYEFSNMLDKDGKGPMSPVMAANYINKEIFKVHISGIYRLDNNQAYDYTYDHLIIWSKGNGFNLYNMFIDLGTYVIPVAVWSTNKKLHLVGNLYKKEISEVRRKYHLANMEADAYAKDNPIMVFNDESFNEMFEELEIIINKRIKNDN